MSAQTGGWDTVVRSNREKAEEALTLSITPSHSAALRQLQATQGQAYATLALVDALEYYAATNNGAVG